MYQYYYGQYKQILLIFQYTIKEIIALKSIGSVPSLNIL